MSKNLVSIIITTKNEEKNIENCLLSIQNQDYKNIEVIVVDNYSSDKTLDIAKKFTKKIISAGPERSKQRNLGVGKALGEYVLYLDADMIVNQKLIEKSVEMMSKNNNLVALYIPEVVLGSDFLGKVRRFERSFYDATPVDCVRFIKKTVFKSVGGFDLDFTGPEDWDLDKKIKKIGQVALLNNYNFEKINDYLNKNKFDVNKLNSLSNQGIIFHNETNFNLKKYLQKKDYYGNGIKKYVEKWGKNDEDVKFQLGFWNRFFVVFLGEKKKIIRFFSHPILVFGMYFLKFLIAWQYLWKK
ncbi:MAG: glycosyltransferase [Candidatus Shapirobacteria bacterium]